MRWARSQPAAVAVKFGIKGKKGTEPNFQLAYADGQTRSFRFPARDGTPVEETANWTESRLTEPVPV